MQPIRKIIFHGTAFKEFLISQKEVVQRKIMYVINIVRTEKQIPAKFFRSIENSPGLYEIRVEMESNIFRIFCCFDEGRLVVLFNGFQKKMQKTPPKEIERANALMKNYFETKSKEEEHGY